MNDTKVQRYTPEELRGAALFSPGNKTIAAMLMQAGSDATLLAKYQRLHKADVGYDESGSEDAYEERRLAMEALATHPQEPTK